MKITETVKDLASLVQKMGNLEMAKQIVDLQSQIIDLVEENHQLRDENRRLKERATTQEQLLVRKNSYWRGSDGPFCMQCWDAEGLLMRLVVQTGFAPMCPRCDTAAPDPNRD
jgi:regulator of replication initiation timing